MKQIEQLLFKASNFVQKFLLLFFRLNWGWQFFQTGQGKFVHHERVVGFFSNLHIPFPELTAWFAAGVECVGGLLLIAGLASRPVGLILTINMIIAYMSVESDRQTVFNFFKDQTPFLQADPFLFAYCCVDICLRRWSNFARYINSQMVKAQKEKIFERGLMNFAPTYCFHTICTKFCWNINMPVGIILLIILAAILPAYAQVPDYDGPPPSKLQVRCNINKKPSNTVNQGPLTAVELQHLGAHDIMLVIDKSGSMNTCDCPKVEGASAESKVMQLLLAPRLFAYGSNPLTKSSRWDWCAAQTVQMAQQAQAALPNGFTVIPFSDGHKIYRNMTTETLPEVYKANRPFGGTYLSPVLQHIADDYFKRRFTPANQCKPLLIGIITDGVPLDPDRVIRTIVDITHQMRDANEITIVFFLIGQDDAWGNQFISNLFYDLPRKGASFNIVRAIPFQQLQTSGLARSLALNL